MPPDALAGYARARAGLAHRFRSAGVLAVEGADRAAFLQGQLTQDVRGLGPGEARPAAGLTPKGKLLYFGWLAAQGDRLLLLVPRDVRSAVASHLGKYAVFQKVAVADVSDGFVLLGLYGPDAAGFPTPERALRLPEHGEFAAGILAPAEGREELDRLLSEAGSAAVSGEAAEILRVESGRPRFGTDADGTNLPDEVGLAPAISTTKGCYVGQEIVARQRTYGRVNRRLVGLSIPGRPRAAGHGLPRRGKARSRARPGHELRGLPPLRRHRPRFRFSRRPRRGDADGARRPGAARPRRVPALRVTPRAEPGRWEIHAALAGAQVGFALFPILGKIALSSIPPFLFAAFRVTAAAVLLDVIRRLHDPEKIRAADRPRIFLYGLLGVSFNQVLFIFGLFLTTAINTTILTATIPVFTLGAAVVLGRERLTRRATAGILLAGAGALALLNAQRFDWGSASLRGDLLLLANCSSYSLYLVLSRPVLAHYRVVTFTAAVFRYGAILIVLVALPDLLRFDAARVTPAAWACLGSVILFCTVFPYLLNSWALARTHASRVAFYVFLQPLISTVLAVAVLGEALTPKTIVAGLLIFAGLAATLVAGRLPARPLP